MIRHKFGRVNAKIKSVHATEGKLQDVEARAVVNFPIAQFTTWLDMRDNGMFFCYIVMVPLN